MCHFIRLLASLFGPIGCSGSWSENMAGMAVELYPQSVKDWDQSDVSACSEFTFSRLSACVLTRHHTPQNDIPLVNAHA